MRSSSLILFMVPGIDHISGGILSIFALCRLSREMRDLHRSHVQMCFFPKHAGPIYRYTMFDNDAMICPFEMVLATCRRIKKVLLHVPEYMLEEVVRQLGVDRLRTWKKTYGLRVNILNQNNLHMPASEYVQQLHEALPGCITCTTAHPAYSTEEWRHRWGVPVHHLPAWTYPDEPVALPYETKQDVMIVSPDPSPYRDRVLQRIREELPQIELKVIANMRFPDYLQLTRVAKWSLTFGEGLDDYFAGTILRGGVGCAVYNESFFTPEFGGRRTIYTDWTVLEEQIVNDIRALDNKDAFEEYNAELRPLLTKSWSQARTRAALAEYYRGNFTWP